MLVIYLASGQPQKSYPGETEWIKEQIQILFTMTDVTSVNWIGRERERKKKWNEPGKQNGKKKKEKKKGQNSRQHTKYAKLYSDPLQAKKR